MPEGHVTHRMAATYRDAFSGGRTRSWSPQGRFAQEAAVIDGLELLDADCVGKHLFLHFGPPPAIVHVHLGMAGKSRLHRDERGATGSDGDPEQSRALDDLGPDAVDGPASAGARPVRGAVRWRLENEGAWLDLTGPAVCELLDEEGYTALLERLGPDPLRADADPERAWRRIQRSSQPIAALLMDQQCFAGVGNIFRAESLYRAGLDPMLPGVALRRAEFEALWADLVELMEYALAHGRIDTVRPEHTPEATGRAPRVDRHGGEVYVYRRAEQTCHVCGRTVRTSVLAARNLFWCPGCQPLSRRAAAVEARRAAQATRAARRPI